MQGQFPVRIAESTNARDMDHHASGTIITAKIPHIAKAVQEITHFKVRA